MKNNDGLADMTDPDDAPELTADLLAEAEVFHGETFVRRADGRAKAIPAPAMAAQEQISIRLDADLLALLRAAGPGWQSQINGLLRQSLGMKPGMP